MNPRKRRGGPGQPFAHRKRLGWTIQGSFSAKSNCDDSVNILQESIESQLQRLWTTDFPEKQHDDSKLPSLEDNEAIHLVQNATEKHENRLIIGMPWKTNKENIPNNKLVADRRLESRKLNSDFDLNAK